MYNIFYNFFFSLYRYYWVIGVEKFGGLGDRVIIVLFLLGLVGNIKKCEVVWNLRVFCEWIYRC